MKTVVAFLLLVVSMIAGQPTRGRPLAQQQIAPGALQPPAPQNAPYHPSGWKPQGEQFNLPKPQPQHAYGLPSPAASYGPPPQEATTADYDVINSTDLPQPAKVGSKTNSEQTSAAAKDQKGAYFVILPQSAPVVLSPPQNQNLVYAYSELPKNTLVAVPQTSVAATPLKSAPVQAFTVPTYQVIYSPLTSSYAQVDW